MTRTAPGPRTRATRISGAPSGSACTTLLATSSLARSSRSCFRAVLSSPSSWPASSCRARAGAVTPRSRTASQVVAAGVCADRTRFTTSHRCQTDTAQGGRAAVRQERQACLAPFSPPSLVRAVRLEWKEARRPSRSARVPLSCRNRPGRTRVASSVPSGTTGHALRRPATERTRMRSGPARRPLEGGVGQASRPAELISLLTSFARLCPAGCSGSTPRSRRPRSRARARRSSG
jgi:hypothetical protein